MLFVSQTELIILLVVCAIAAACLVAAIVLSVWIMLNRQRKQTLVRELIGLSVDAAAVKQDFDLGEEFSYDGLVVNAVYNLEPTAETLTQFEALTEEEYAHLTAAGSASGLYVIKPNMTKAGRAIVIIRYKDKATYYAITVSDPAQEAQEAFAAQPEEETAPVQAQAEPAEEPAEEPVEEPAEVPMEEQPEEAPAEEETEEAPAELFTERSVRYNKSFTARLIQSDDEVKSWYGALKNDLLSYKKVKARMSWKRESFHAGRRSVARFGFRGNTLCIYLPLDPASYEGTKYKVEDASAYADTPCMYRLKNARRVRYAAELIASLMSAWDIPRIEREAEDYYIPYEGTEALIGKGLIKVENGGSIGVAPAPQAPAEEVAPAAEEAPTESAEEPEEIVEEVAPAAEEAPTEPAEEPAEEGEAHVVLPFDTNAERYDMSFAARLIQSDDEVKRRYAALKEELLSYKRVKARRSWKRESYHFGRKNVVRFSFRGKTLCMYFALDPDAFGGTKYKVESVEGSASYADTPCLYRMKNDRRARYAKDLIALVMGSVGAARNEGYAPEEIDIPYEDTETLLARGLIRIVNKAPGQIAPYAAEEVAAAEVFEQPAEEVIAEEQPEAAPTEEVPEEQPEEVPAEELVAEEVAEEPVVEEIVEEEQPAEETVTETLVEEAPEEQPEEAPAEEPAVEETEVEELSTQELDDVQSYEEEEIDEDGIEVVGVMFRRRGRKVYWFDPNGKTWEKGEIALYITPDNPPQEVIVVDNTKRSPSKLHLPLKPLQKAARRPKSPKE